MKTAYFERFEIDLTEEEARRTSHQGDCMSDVLELLETPHVQAQIEKIDPTLIREELDGYGAWDDSELLDPEANRERIIWIAAGIILDDIQSPDPVIFRKFPEGDVIALFPNMIDDSEGNITSYQHVGQHSGASPELINKLDHATEKEYRPLADELINIGYNLVIWEE